MILLGFCSRLVLFGFVRIFCLILIGRSFQVQTGMVELNRFQRNVKLQAFQPFSSAENALLNMNAITEHEMTDDLRVRFISNVPLC